MDIFVVASPPSTTRVRNTSVNDHKYSINQQKLQTFDDVHFKSDICKVNWYTITTHNNIDDAVNDLESKFTEVANRHAPLRKKRVSHTISPWLIVKAMRERDNAKKRAIKAKFPQLWEQLYQGTQSCLALSRSLMAFTMSSITHGEIV